MRAGWAGAAAMVLVVGGCAHSTEPSQVDTGQAGRSNRELAGFLPVLADYPGPSWDVTLTVGGSSGIFGPYIDPGITVEPAGCAEIPFQRRDLVAASSDGVVQNGIAGDAGRAAVRIMRDPHGADLIADTVAWAKRCHEYRQMYPSTGPGDPSTSDPTAVSVLPPLQVEGVDVTRIHLTDNRAHRYQGDGTRESVISLARVRGLVVVGYRHDRDQEAAAILALTLRRLSTDRPAAKPLSDKADLSALTRRTDKELQQLLPSVVDAPDGWTILQRSPIIRDSTDDGESATGCGRLPFEDAVGYRSDLHRGFREIASVTVGSTPDTLTTSDSVTLGVENHDAAVIEETTTWAKQCGLDMLPTPQLDGIDVTSIRLKAGTDDKAEQTVSLLRVRGLLVITRSALTQQNTQLAHQSIENLRHAEFDTPPTGPDPMPFPPDPYVHPPGDVPFPNPTADATTRLARVGKGLLVNPEPYHMGGYMPGDSPTRSSDDYLHFRSPSGAIACTWFKYTLVCDVPHGTYPRTPKPADLHSVWQDSVSVLGWFGLQNGLASDDPVVYAVSNVLPYGNTLRLIDGTECLMEIDGLTCVDYGKRIGFHLSRTDLTPLAATKELTDDTRSQPH